MNIKGKLYIVPLVSYTTSFTRWKISTTTECQIARNYPNIKLNTETTSNTMQDLDKCL